MSRSLEAALEAVRAREVPWDAERSARVGRRIGASRGRSGLAAPLARWAVGGLASVALSASVLHITRASPERGAPEPRLHEPAAPSAAASAVPPDDEAFAERPVGDGGFE